MRGMRAFENANSIVTYGSSILCTTEQLPYVHRLYVDTRRHARLFSLDVFVGVCAVIDGTEAPGAAARPRPRFGT